MKAILVMEMPERKEGMSLKAVAKQPYRSGFFDGWNDCLKAIEGR